MILNKLYSPNPKKVCEYDAYGISPSGPHTVGDGKDKVKLIVIEIDGNYVKYIHNGNFKECEEKYFWLVIETANYEGIGKYEEC